MMSSRPVIEPRPAIPALLELFDTYPLVGLGEMHMCQDEADFITALLHHPAFPETVQVIVVEFGNARHQPVVDRFVAGEPVAARELRPVWRDFIVSCCFDAPIYEQFFRTVRAINRTLPPDKRLRVLIGDVPVDWSQIRQEADILPWVEQREAHYTEVVETHILAPGLHGLLIAGVGHFWRDWPRFAAPGGTVGDRLERNHPNCLHVINPHIGFGRETSALEPHLADWPIPSLVSLHNTWLGELDVSLLEGAFFILSPDDPPLPSRRWDSLADSYLYLGPRNSLAVSMPNPAIYRGDELYLSELQRRRSAGLPFAFPDFEDLLTEGDPRYFTYLLTD